MEETIHRYLQDYIFKILILCCTLNYINNYILVNKHYYIIINTHILFIIYTYNTNKDKT